MELTYRQAAREDIPDILTICDEAREFQRSRGSMQWKDGYPSESVILSDIDKCRGWVIESPDGDSAGYCVVDTEGDSEYDGIEGLWHTGRPYAAVHRLAFSDRVRGKGYGRLVLADIESRLRDNNIHAIRVDTGLENLPMQRILESLDYSNLGVHDFSWGKRIAYEKELC